MGKLNVHVGTTLKVNAVVEAALGKNGKPAYEQKNGDKSKEILGFAHPVDIGLFEEPDHPVLLPFLRLQAVPDFSRKHRRSRGVVAPHIADSGPSNQSPLSTEKNWESRLESPGTA